MTQQEIKVGKKRVQKKGAAKVRHLGRRKTQIARYYEVVYPRTKLRHILKNNGYEAARAWAMKNGQLALLSTLARKMGLAV